MTILSDIIYECSPTTFAYFPRRAQDDQFQCAVEIFRIYTNKISLVSSFVLIKITQFAPYNQLTFG